MRKIIINILAIIGIALATPAFAYASQSSKVCLTQAAKTHTSNLKSAKEAYNSALKEAQKTRVTSINSARGKKDVIKSINNIFKSKIKQVDNNYDLARKIAGDVFKDAVLACKK